MNLVLEGRAGDLLVVHAPEPGAFGVMPGLLELVCGDRPTALEVLAWGDRIVTRLPVDVKGGAHALRVVPFAPLAPVEARVVVAA